MRNRYWFAALRHPSGNALSDAQFQAIDNLLMRILRCPQYQFVILANVNKAGVTLHDRGSKLDNLIEILMEGISSSHTAADVMQKINIDVVMKGIGAHDLR